MYVCVCKCICTNKRVKGIYVHGWSSSQASNKKQKHDRNDRRVQPRLRISNLKEVLLPGSISLCTAPPRMPLIKEW